jgi:hypothetical protein
MTYDKFQKSIKRIEEDITLAKFLSELKLTKKDRVVIYDDSCNLVFDSDDQDLCLYYEMWEVLEETVCQVSDVTENGVRTVCVFMTY